MDILYFACYIVTFPISPLVAKIRRTESVPSDINNPVDRPPEAPQFGTLPKAITKKVKKKWLDVLYNTAQYHFIVAQNRTE